MKVLYSTIGIFYCLMGQSQIGNSKPLAYITDVVSYLADDKMKGREPGTKEGDLAGSFIYNEFKKQKIRVKCQNFTYIYEKEKIKAKNIIGFINNHASKTVLISAHYDHIGLGGILSMSKGVQGVVHNGADDNASGVALMLSLVSNFLKLEQDFNYIFVAYSGHEMGLHGSKFFAESKFRKNKNIIISINFDMVGRLNDNNLIYYDCSDSLKNSIKSLNESGLMLLKSSKARLQKLDSKWLYEQQVPSITWTTGMHCDYHRISDDAQYINYQGILKIKKMIVKWVVKFQNIQL